MIALVILQWALVAVQVGLLTTAQSAVEVVVFGFGLLMNVGFAVYTALAYLDHRRH